MTPLMKADTPNRSAIEAQIDKVVQARADLEKANARFLLDIRMQITPEQWKQLQTMREERKGHEGDREDHRWGHDGGRARGVHGREGFHGGPGGPPPTAPQKGAPAPGMQPPAGGAEQ